MKVYCEIIEEEVDGDHGRPVLSVRAVCSRCGHETTSFGTDQPSIRRCLALMRDECPENENNFYVEDK